MPSGKGRSKEDTWKESDLKKAIQGDKKERSSRRDDERRERRSDRDDDRRRRERREDLVNGEDKDRERRSKERGSDKDRRRDRERDGDKPRERSDRDRERRREQEGESSGKERREKERSERDKDTGKERERRRERDGESSGKDRRERDKRDRDLGESEGRRRDRDKESDKDRERRHRSRREHESSDQSRDVRKGREKDDETGSDDRRKDRERRRRREEGESSRHHDDSRDRKRERSRERDHRDRRKEREQEESRRHRDKSGERRDKRRERDDRDRRREKEEHDADKEIKVKEREKKMLDSLRDEEEVISKGKPSRGERFRADTLEEADVVDEEEDTKDRRRRNSTLKADEVNNEEESSFNYEEDFEDYEDDFENEQDDDEEIDLPIEDRNAGMQELLKAINLENETVTVSREGSKMSRSSDDDSRREPVVRPITAKGRINFVAAKQKQISEKVASRTRKRGQELMHLIDLDVVVFEMFDLPPMNEYELYIKNFGRSDTKQAYVQCNDDNLEKDIQTEEIETRTMWTQYPAEDFAGCGDEKGSKQDTSSFTHAAIDSVRLTRFLETAGQACLVLLEEESADQSSKIVKEKKELTCSDGYIPLATKQPYLAGRVLECLHVSPVQNHLILTAYGPVTDHEKASTKINDSLKTKSIICLWNVNEPSAPQKILVCESVPRSCCLSPSKATIGFAGLEDGSVVAWDLRESPSIHHSYSLDDHQVTFRSPTFSTAGVLSQDNHHSPVVSLLPVVMPGDSAKASTSLSSSLQSDDMLGLSFQLASLEENAVINIWVVVELGVADIAGSESDLGLAPGGKIKLIKSASLPLEPPVRSRRKTTALQTHTVRFLPQDPNHFYVGTDSGYVLHLVRHGGRAPPKTYGPQIECLVDVTTLDVSPWQLPCLLAGSRDGSVRLYNLNNDLPLNTWTHSTKGSRVLSVQWSNSVPSVFFVLDVNSTLYIWDLLKSDSEPVAIEKLKQGSVISFELSSDYSASGVGVPGRNAELVLGYKDGSVEVHKINAQFSKASPDILDRFNEYLESGL